MTYMNTPATKRWGGPIFQAMKVFPKIDPLTHYLLGVFRYAIFPFLAEIKGRFVISNSPCTYCSICFQVSVLENHLTAVNKLFFFLLFGEILQDFQSLLLSPLPLPSQLPLKVHPVLFVTLDSNRTFRSTHPRINPFSLSFSNEPCLINISWSPNVPACDSGHE